MDLKQFNWILSKGIDVNMFTVLLLIHEGNKFDDTSDIKVKSWLLLLTKHQLIDSNQLLTEKGEIYISEFKSVSSEKSDSFNFEIWCEQLHAKLKERLIKLTGKGQKVAKIRTSSYSFLCNVNDLSKKMKNFVKVYKVKDYAKIEKTLLAYIDKCHKQDSWFPLIEYYIMKDGTSKLATDLESIDQIIEDTNTEIKQPVDTKDLF